MEQFLPWLASWLTAQILWLEKAFLAGIIAGLLQVPMFYVWFLLFLAVASALSDYKQIEGFVARRIARHPYIFNLFMSVPPVIISIYIGVRVVWWLF